MKRGGKCRGEEWSRGRRQRGRLGRREVIFTRCSGQVSDSVAFVWRRPKMVCQQARERQAQPRQTSNNSLRRQVTQEPLRGPRWWGFGACSGVPFSFSAPPAPPTDAGTAPWGFTHGSAEGWRGWTLIWVNMNKATEIHKHSGAPSIKNTDTLAGWFSYLGGQSRMHQQWKKHSGFSEHIYAENSRRRSAWVNFPLWASRLACHLSSWQESSSSPKRVWGELCCQPMIQGFTSCQGCLRMRQEEEAKHSESEKGRKWKGKISALRSSRRDTGSCLSSLLPNEC